jgi:hypothetical protein
VTRVGADEFAFLYPMVFSEGAAAAKARMLIEILSAPYDVGERTARLSASAGCSLFSSGDETTDLLFNKAETALYHAKRSGRGGVVVFTREMEEAAKRVTRIEQALRRAVSASEVEPHFQPIVDLKSRKVIGFEALAPARRSAQRNSAQAAAARQLRYGPVTIAMRPHRLLLRPHSASTMSSSKGIMPSARSACASSGIPRSSMVWPNTITKLSHSACVTPKPAWVVSMSRPI